MAYWFGDGFDCYTQITDCGTYWDASFGTASLALSASGRFAGSRGIIGTAAGGASAYIAKTSGVNDAVHHLSFAIQQTGTLSGTSIYLFITLYDGATAQCSLVFNSVGTLSLTSGLSNGAVLGTQYTNAIAAINTWYQFEIEVVINNTTGSWSVRRNGNTTNDHSDTGLNTRGSANNYANKMGVGNGIAGTQMMDDLLWRSDATSGVGNAAWVGDIRCFTRMPAADSSVAWTRSGSVVPLTPFVSGATQTIGTNSARYFPFTATCSGTLGTVSLSLVAGYTGNLKCSLFSNSGSNAPGTVIASATTLANPATGGNTITFPSPPSVTAGTVYWLGLESDTASGSWNGTSGTAGAGSYPLSGVTSATTYASFPTANPSVTTGQYVVICTLNITPTTLANADFVSEVVQDGANTYNYSSTVSQSDLYTIAAIGSTPSSVLAVTTRGFMQKSDAGTRLAAVQLQSGATNVQATPLALPAGSWAWNWRTDLTDPNTGAAWTPTAVNNATIGAIVTT